MILFFQQPSWLLVLLAWWQIRFCDAVIFFQFKDLSRDMYSELPGAGLRRLIRFLNPRVRFERIPEELYLSLWLDNNAASDQEMDRVFESETLYYRIVRRLRRRCERASGSSPEISGLHLPRMGRLQQRSGWSSLPFYGYRNPLQARHFLGADAGELREAV